MWSPTHVQVVVQRAKGLITKGKKGTNDCFVTIALGKSKYQTSVKEKASENVDWHEECELPIPEQGNTAEIVLTALHRNFLGVDEFLGTVRIPLSSFDIYEMPKNRWYELTSKPGKENTKERGHIEARIGFVVRAGSLTDLTKKEKHKSSLGQLSTAAQSIGGSLLSIGSGEKRKGLKKLAKSIGSKVKGKSKSKSKLDDIYDEEEFRVVGDRPVTTGQEQDDADPGVISDDDEFAFDDLSHKSSTSSLNSARSGAAPANNHHIASGNNKTLTESPHTGVKSLKNNKISNNSSPQLSNVNNSSISLSSQKTNSVSTPPSKPPRFGLGGSASNVASPNLSSSIVDNVVDSVSKAPQQQQTNPQIPDEDEWGQKLYGLQAGGTLKRWENKRASPKIVIDESPKESTTTTPAPQIPSITVTTESKQQQQHSTPIPALRGSSPISKFKGEIGDSPNPGGKVTQLFRAKDRDRDKYKIVENKKSDKDNKDHKQQKSSSERIIIGGEESSRITDGNNATNGRNGSRLPREIVEQFEGKTREDLIDLVLQLQLDVADKKKRLHDMEEYIDSLLLRVIECSPKLLQNPYTSSRRLSSPGRQ